MLQGEQSPCTTGNQASRSHKETTRDIKFLGRKIRTLASEKWLLLAFPEEAIHFSKDERITEYSSHRTNTPSTPLSKLRNNSQRGPALVFPNTPKSLKLNTEPSLLGGVGVVGATCWLHRNAAYPWVMLLGRGAPRASLLWRCPHCLRGPRDSSQ